jgi:hypothetical protein
MNFWLEIEVVWQWFYRQRGSKSDLAGVPQAVKYYLCG